ncbi:MAG: hypothetical protein OXG84_00125 [Chloroflexi bacterium]|nr:hypothetical protein [Chloroflexota bacterium]
MDIRLPLPAAFRHRLQSGDPLWAFAVSLIFSPPLVWAVWVYSVILPGKTDRANAVWFASLFVLSICVAPMLFVAYKVRNGKISDMHMRISRERYVPYSIAIIAGLVAVAIMFSFDADPLLQVITLASIVELTIILAGTFFVHISLHAMAMASIISATALVFGLGQSLLFVPLLLLVILARLVLKRHNAIEILIGVLIGLLTPMGLVAALGLLL